MKNEQVVPDYIVMLESSITVLALVGCGWLLIKFEFLRISLKRIRGFYVFLSQTCVSLYLVPTIHEEA